MELQELSWLFLCKMNEFRRVYPTKRPAEQKNRQILCFRPFGYNLFTCLYYNRVIYAKVLPAWTRRPYFSEREVASFMCRQRFTRLYFWVTVCVCLLGVALRTVCMLTQYDAAIGYFERGFWPVASDALYFLAAAAAAIGAWLLPRASLTAVPSTPYRPPFAYLTGVLLAAFAVCLSVTSRAALFTKSGAALTALVCLSVASLLYFFITGHRHGPFRDALTSLGFLPILWSMSAIAVTYTDPYVAMNSPIKVSLHMGLLGFMLIMLGELGCRVGKPVSRKTVTITAIGVFAALNASVPLIAAARVNTASLYTLCAGVLLAAGLYGGYMLFCYTHGPVALDKSADESDTPSDTPADPTD